MQKFYELDGLVPELNQQEVFKAMDCYEDSPVYEEMAEEYENVKEEILSLAKPVGILGFGTLPEKIATEDYKTGTPVIFAVTSIGGEISGKSTQAFKEGDYVKGLLFDTMGDNILFSLEKPMMKKLQQLCGDLKVGISRRLEAPYDISMEAQKTAWEYLELKERFDIGISSGYMFDPVKTSCLIFILTENEKLFQAHHDCRNCPNVTCRLRNIPKTSVTVMRNGQEQELLLEERESLLDGLVRANFYISAPCGGDGRCGKCRVRVLEGKADISEEDRKFMTEQELEEGYRLACRIYSADNLKVEMEESEESSFEILSGEEKTESSIAEEEYEIAVDIGTTTIAMQLLGKKSGDILHTYTCINRQRVCGADVISRIQASVDGKKEILQKIIQRDLIKGIRNLLQQASVSVDRLARICIAANTTMVHLLMGYDCDTLGVYPFQPVNIDFIKTDYKTLFDSEECGVEVVILPGVSTYVGGDIVSGMYACGMDKTEEICMLIDLGTNGEMALGNKNRIMVTSTAAGPAFEGGNICWGTGSVAGAICSVEIHDKKASVKTIQEEQPVGICGTGVVEAIAELVREEIVDETGCMAEEYFETGFSLAETKDGRAIAFTRKDVREIQLAKSAVRAGIETLLLRYGVNMEQVDRVYIAGGFGYKLNIEKAAAIELLPGAFRDRIETVGNSSLAGAAAFLRNERSEACLQKLIEVSQEISLSADKDFNEFYMDYMMFSRDL